MRHALAAGSFSVRRRGWCAAVPLREQVDDVTGSSEDMPRAALACGLKTIGREANNKACGTGRP